MRKKKVWRYYCEFCKKSGCSCYHLRRHEERCTKNPNRLCGMCKMRELPQPELKDLMAILPDPEKYKSLPDEFDSVSYIGLEEAVSKVYNKLFNEAEGCPACIMAALRQKGIPVPMVEEFNFTEECKSIWADINAANRDTEGY